MNQVAEAFLTNKLPNVEVELVSLVLYNETAYIKVTIVVHKTTPFMREKIIGITQAPEGINDIELVQIQAYCPWRAIKFGAEDSLTAAPFTVKRGMTMQLSSDSFLLWDLWL